MDRTKLLVGGLVGIAFVTTTILLVRRQENKRASGPGSPEDAWWVEGPGGSTLVVDDRLSARRFNGQRLAAIDVATGKRLATRVLDRSGADCEPVLAGRLWCQFTNVELVDARTLATVSTLDATLRGANLSSAVPPRVVITPEAAYAVISDGRVARIDTASLTVTTVDTAPEGAVLSLMSPTRARCKLADDVKTTSKLLEPKQLADVAQATVVQHVTSLDATARTMLARIDAAGATTWDVEGGPCQLARENGGTLVVATTNPRRRAYAVDLTSGAVSWTLAFD